MLTVLGLIDVVMIANLLIMVIVGGYETFVSRLNLQDHPDQPEWPLARERGRAQSEARDGTNWHFVDSLAEDFHRGRAAIEQGDPLANRHSSHICCLAFMLAWTDRLTTSKSEAVGSLPGTS